MRESLGDRIFGILNTIFMVFICAVMLYPILFVVGRSLMSDMERAARPFALVPREFTAGAYQFIFMKGPYIVKA